MVFVTLLVVLFLVYFATFKCVKSLSGQAGFERFFAYSVVSIVWMGDSFVRVRCTVHGPIAVYLYRAHLSVHCLQKLSTVPMRCLIVRMSVPVYLLFKFLALFTFSVPHCTLVRYITLYRL